MSLDVCGRAGPLSAASLPAPRLPAAAHRLRAAPTGRCRPGSRNLKILRFLEICDFFEKSPKFHFFKIWLPDVWGCLVADLPLGKPGSGLGSTRGSTYPSPRDLSGRCPPSGRHAAPTGRCRPGNQNLKISRFLKIHDIFEKSPKFHFFKN